MANERCQQNSHKWQTSVDSLASSDIGEVLSLFYKSLDCFTMRLFHSATIFLLLHMYMYLLFETSPGWLPGWRGFFLTQFWWGALSSNVFTICAVFWSLGRRGYFGVSNGVLVNRIFMHYIVLNTYWFCNWKNVFMNSRCWILQILSNYLL